MPTTPSERGKILPLTAIKVKSSIFKSCKHEAQICSCSIVRIKVKVENMSATGILQKTHWISSFPAVEGVCHLIKAYLENDLYKRLSKNDLVHQKIISANSDEVKWSQEIIMNGVLQVEDSTGEHGRSPVLDTEVWINQ